MQTRESTLQPSRSLSASTSHSAKRVKLMPMDIVEVGNLTNASASTSRSHRGVTQTNGNAGPSLKPFEVTPETLETERAALLAERQSLLSAVSDRHDDLVRELFHMRNFVTMVDYNPNEAKADESAVFNEFKSQFDLLDHATFTSGSIRQTRRRANERRQLIANPTSTPSAHSPSKKKKGNAKAATSEEIWNIISSNKSPKKTSKLKDAGATLTENVDMMVRPSKRTVEGAEHTVIDLTRPKTAPLLSASAAEAGDTVYVKRKSRQSKGPMAASPESISTAAIEWPGAKRRRKDETPPPSPNKITGPVLCSSNGLMKENVYPSQQVDDTTSFFRRTGRTQDAGAQNSSFSIKIRPPKDPSISVIQPTMQNLDSVPTSSPSKYAIKRIKLIVRRPPPRLSNPKQRAPEPRFNSSIDKFLSSYVSIDDDGENAETEDLEKEAMEEAQLREQVDKLRREGRFVSRRESTSDEEEDEDIVESASMERTSKDIWDAIVEEVVARRKKRRGRPLAQQVTSAIASKVQAHFDAIEAKKAKMREVEERKLRLLAKTTMKMVVAEWKKAVFHIREKHRQELEDEERRLGHEHLDAILNQSGQLLETQQVELIRTGPSRSRSGSLPAYGDEQDRTDEEEEDDNDNDDEVGGGDHEDQQEDGLSDTPMRPDRGSMGFDDEADDESSHLLLGDHFSARSLSRPETPATTTSFDPEPDSDQEERDTTLTGDLIKQLGAEDVESSAPRSPEPSLGELLSPPDTSPVQESTSAPLSSVDSMPSSDRREEAHNFPSPPTSEPIEPSSHICSPGPGLSESGETPLNIPGPQSNDIEDTSDDGLQTNNDSVDNNHLDTQSEQPTAMDGSQTEGDQNQALVKGGEEVLENGEAQETVQPDNLGTNDHQLPANGAHDEDLPGIQEYLKPYAVAPMRCDVEKKLTQPLLLRGILRPYQQSGLEWLASLHTNRLNGILADEMGLGKTIQTIALLAHLACDLGIWGPHLIVVPTSVLLNWEMEFKKFLPGFRILSYHGTTKRRKELRQGWNDKHHFNVCITSYALASRDGHIFKRKSWYYMILDEAHMIKNFKSQRWSILLMFRSYRRLLLTGTPLQNNLTELWALLQFLMSGANFANLKEFGEWFSNPLEKAIEMGQTQDDDTLQRVSKLHTVLRPYLLRRLKRDVEKELPSKFEHLTLCPLSKRQRFLYDEFMSRAQTRDALRSGIYQKIANILMQLRKVCNHPDLFEVRPIVTSFAMPRSAIADFEIEELLIRRKLLMEEDEKVNLSVIGLHFINRQESSLLVASETKLLDATTQLPYYTESAGEPPPRDMRTIAGFRRYSAYQTRAQTIARWAHMAYLNKLRCSQGPIYGAELLTLVKTVVQPILPFTHLDRGLHVLDRVEYVNKAVKSFSIRAIEMSSIVSLFAFMTPAVIAQDLSRIALAGMNETVRQQPLEFDDVLHPAAVKLQIAFPEPSLLQYDCGKLQKLSSLLREKKAGGHRVLIFTQMTRILDILETFLNFHGYLYLRLDGATKIEDRQYITERYNADSRIFCFISSSRSGGVGINLTGADTVVFYDSDFNPQMDRQCEDRAHRIGQIRDVHIYRFVSQFTVEEAMLRKANQKRSLDDLVIQKGEFDWRSLFSDESTSALSKALGDYEDTEDRIAAAAAAREETSLVGADQDDFDDADRGVAMADHTGAEGREGIAATEEPADDEQEEGGTVVEYMVSFVERDWDFFGEWRL